MRAYLEYSAAYFKQVTGTGPFAADAVTNAITPTAPNGTPDYNYDIMGGLDRGPDLRHRHRQAGRFPHLEPAVRGRAGH